MTQEKTELVTQLKLFIAHLVQNGFSWFRKVGPGQDTAVFTTAILLNTPILKPPLRSAAELERRGTVGVGTGPEVLKPL